MADQKRVLTAHQLAAWLLLQPDLPVRCWGAKEGNEPFGFVGGEVEEPGVYMKEADRKLYPCVTLIPGWDAA